MLPWSFSEEAAAEKYMAQLQHNMRVVASRAAVLSVITGGGKWVEITTYADPLYQHLILTAERKFWRCVESAEPCDPLDLAMLIAEEDSHEEVLIRDSVALAARRGAAE